MTKIDCHSIHELSCLRLALEERFFEENIKVYILDTEYGHWCSFGVSYTFSLDRIEEKLNNLDNHIKDKDVYKSWSEITLIDDFNKSIEEIFNNIKRKYLEFKEGEN